MFARPSSHHSVMVKNKIKKEKGEKGSADSKRNPVKEEQEEEEESEVEEALPSSVVFGKFGDRGSR